MAPSTLSNKVNPLTWNVPIVDTKTGNPTPEFQRKWQQQAAANASVTDLTTAKAVSAVIDLISSTVGALLVRGASQWTGLVPVADGRVLRDKGVGATPIWDTISSIIDTLGAVQGDVLYRDAAAWKVLAPGTAGQVLTTGGAAANPSWQTSSAGGGAVSSVNDDGTNFYIALMDVDGQLILDGSGDPVFIPEVLPAGAIPPIKGVTDGSNAAAGVVGEYLHNELLFAARVAATTTAVADLFSITLTPGDWDVEGSVAFFPVATTQVTNASGWINDTSATNPLTTRSAGGFFASSIAYTSNGTVIQYATGKIRYSVTTNTVVYLSYRHDFSVSTSTVFGSMNARRVR